MRRFSVLLSLLFAVSTALVGAGPVAANPAALGIAPSPPVTYAPGDLNGQNGWDGGIVGGNPVPFTNNNANSDVVTNADAYAGTQSWRYSGSYSSPGPGTPMSPDVATVGAPNAVAAEGSPITPAGDRSVISFAFKAIAPGDGSGISVYEGSSDRTHREGPNVYVETDTAGTVTIYAYRLSSTDSCANQDFPTVDLATVPSGTWHTVKMTTTYPNITSADLSTYGTTTYVIDEGTGDEVTVADQNTSWVHEYDHCNSTPYAPGGSVKWSNFFNDYPTHQGFYIDDVSMKVINTGTSTTVATFATGFEANFPGPRYVATTGSDTSNTCLHAGTPCATIQHAVDEAFAGDVVHVAAGTYTENLTIDKAITLVGPNADVDPNTGSRAAEAIIAGGTGFTIKPEAQNIVINGFTITAATTGGAHAIYNVGADAADVSGLTIANNIVSGGVRSIAVESDGSNISILHNKIGGYTHDIAMGDGTWPNLKLNDNTFLEPTDGSYAIQMGPDGTGPINGFELKNNHMVGSNNIGSNITNGTVSGNVFNQGASGDLELQIALHNSTVSGNTFNGSGTSSCLQLFGSQYGLVASDTVAVTGNAFNACNAFGVQLSPDIDHINIAHNTFTNSYDGVNTRTVTAWDLSGKDIHVNDNSITGSTHFGVNNAVSGTLDASCNWWGDSSGPSGGGAGTGDSVTAHVGFIPWLTSSNLNGACAEPEISLTPATHPFGSQLVGTTSATSTFTVQNVGTANLTIASVSLAGTNPGQFGIDTNNCFGQVLAHNATCTVLVDFRPFSLGDKTAQLVVGSSDPANPSVHSDLTGTGTQPGASLSPTTKDYGSVVVNATSSDQTFTLTNTGNAPLHVGTVTITGTNANQFAKGVDGCTGATIAVSGMCDVHVTFQPTTTGAKAATLNVPSDAPTSPQTASLTGTGIQQLGASLSPTTKDYGSVVVNATSSDQTFTLTNTGNAPLHVGTVTITGTNANQFAKGVDGCTGATIAVSGMCDVHVTFQPTTTGAKAATLNVPSDAPTSPQTASLTGTGIQPGASLDPTSKDFGSKVVGTISATSTFTVQNVGTANLTIANVALAGTNPGQFGIDTNNCFGQVLTPNATCTILVNFKPSSSGAKAAQLVVDSNDPVHPSVHSDLTGTGTLASVTGSIQIVLDSRPNSSQNFAFSGGLGAFSLDDDSNAALPNHRTFAGLAAGDYTVTQGRVSKWALIDLSCSASETINKANRTVTIHLGAGENVICSFTDAKRQPDAKIATSSGGSYAGSNVYSSTAIGSQTKNLAVARGHTRSLFVKVQNDSPKKDSFLVDGSLSGSSKFSVKFFRGATDITAQVMAGTYSINNLAAGAEVTIEIRVTAKSSTPASATRNIDVLVTSKSAPAAQDLVRGHVTRA